MKLVLSSLLISVLLLLSCGPRATPTPTVPEPLVSRNEGQIYDVGTWKWRSPNIKAGDRIEVVVAAKQVDPPLEYDTGAGRAVRPGIKPIVVDPFLNYVSPELQPNLLDAPAGYHYVFRYSFFAATEGTYQIFIENLAYKQVTTAFFVEWRVYPLA